ncbi:hypothetical protein [Hyphomicrobium sp. DY-1]|uniref:hypothetical protein n=1 Tax=Hyphomicrobium sp. DY-1 TaxID=3075650 RepID=UPI0039C23803
MSTRSRNPDPSTPPNVLERSFHCTIEEAIARSSLVSFDVFDTLLRRPYAEPTHLFDALGCSSQTPFFGRDRRFAEARARIRHHTQRDVTLAQIYEQLPHPIDRELAFERDSLYPRTDVTVWLSLARAAGKKVVAVSDMYLPKPFIASLLATHRLAVDDLIVSSADDVVKGDGSAFRLLASRHNVQFRDILHFGDNPHADFHAPAALGIRSVLVANKLPRSGDNHHLADLTRALESNGSHHSSSVASVIRDSLVSDGVGSFWPDIGRYIVTPLMVGFARWIHGEAQAAGCDRVAFAARDGRMPREAFHALYGDGAVATPYVHLSRAVALRAGLDTRSEIVLYQLCSGVSAPVSDYIRRLGDGVDALLQRAAKDFHGDPIVGKDIAREELVDFFHAAKDDLAEISRTARPLLYSYLEQHDLLRDPSRVAVADIGWGGTVASVLWHATPETRQWNWLYFGTRKEYEPRDAKHNAMFFSYGIPFENWQLVFDCVEIAEFLFSAPEPSTIALEETPTGVEPVFAAEDTQWEGWAPRVKDMAAGFHDMLPAFVRRAKAPHGLVVDHATVFTLLSHIIRSDNTDVIREFGRLEHQLGLGASKYEPILPMGRMKYWSNIWRLMKGRSLKASAGHHYWRNQLSGQFLRSLTGVKRRIAVKALKVHARGGIFRKRRRR